MTVIRSAAFVDFDSVFSILLTNDPAGAMRFAEDPRRWLPRLSLPPHGHSRRWLMLRCYLTAERSVVDPNHAGDEWTFAKFRESFAEAGFEVIDCPTYSPTTNAAGIRLVIDALDATQIMPHYDEFTVVSGDSDLTPLALRLRALDRRVTLISPTEPPAAMRAAADHVIYGDDLLRLLHSPGTDEAEQRFRALLMTRYASTSIPLNLATLAHEVHDELGPIVRESRWFGHDHFVAAVQSLALPGLRTSQHFLWDQSRHEAPGTTSTATSDAMALTVRLRYALKLPHIPASSWRAVYRELAEFVDTYEFSISAATRWVQAQLASRGMEVSRPTVGMVMRGAASGGCPLYRQPPPGADEIGAAFLAHVLERAGAAGLALSEVEGREVRALLGLSDDDSDLRAG